MKHTTKQELDDDLADVAKNIKNADWSSAIAYEVDKVNRMHLHTIVYITGRPPVFKKLQIPGRQRYFKKIDSSINGYVYISKQKQTPWAIENRFDNNEIYWEKIANYELNRGTIGIKISDLLS